MKADPPGESRSASTTRSTWQAAWRDDPAWPDVDVIMPIRDEADHLAGALAAVRSQQYPGVVRVVMAVAPSDDGTEAIAAQLFERDPDLIVVRNPSGRTPTALNLAIRAGSAPVIVRVDGRSELCDGYVRRAIDTMRRTGAVNVGGAQVPVGTTPFEEAVADATTSWLGTGGATYRVGGEESPVDTVYLGVFDRAAVEAVGLFDERLIRNQDYELNIRLRRDAGNVIFDPELSVGYRPRGSWKRLARQYFEYGRWKAVVMRMHPRAIKLRQLVPPLAVIAVIIAIVIAFWWWPAVVVPLGYTAAVASVGYRAKHPLRTAGVLACIHSAWTAGLLSAVARRVR